MKEAIGAVVMALLLVVTVGLVISYPAMLLWNGCLVGAVAGINPVGWLQAWGILILCGLLFRNPVAAAK